ncbi:MAG: hypothetical protein K5906_04575 [Bacilli bacterium]|nr:hypothetical protein [Bacilli bacterium]
MKKVYLGMLLLGGAALLAGCGGSKPDAAVNFNIQIKGDSVVTEEFKNKNYNLNEDYTNNKRTVKASKNEMPEGYEGVSIALSSPGGLMVYKNKNTEKYGIYSEYAKKFVVEARLTSTYIYTYEDSMFGNLASYKDIDNNYYIIDASGNVLVNCGENQPSSVYASYTEQEYENIKVLLSYLTYTVGTQTKHETFFYKEDGSTTKDIGDIIKPISKKGEVPYVDQDLYDLNQYGIERTMVEYRLDNNDKVYVVYEKDGNEATRIEIPGDYQSYVFGPKILYQRVAGNSTNIELETKMYDLKNLTVKDVEFPAAITDFKELERVNEKDPLVAAVKVREINENKAVGSTRTLIIDNDLVAHDDITYQNFAFWTKLHNGYFYSGNISSTYASGILYDAQYKPVLNFAKIDAEFRFDKEFEFFYSNNYNDIYFQVLNAEGKTMFDEKYYYGDRFTLNNVNYNAIFRAHNAKDLDDNNAYYLDALTGNVVTLENKETDTLKVTETLYADNLVIVRIEQEVVDGVVSEAKKVILKTLDGQVVDTRENIRYIFINMLATNDHFQQRYLDKNYYQIVEYQSMDSTVEIDGSLLSTGEFKVNPVPAPQVA